MPWSLGATSDDKKLKTIDHFINKQVVVTEKLDGENFTLAADRCHARSIDSGSHESRSSVKRLWASIKNDIPDTMKIHGENLFARHSIIYNNLPSYFIVFAISDNFTFLSWEDTKFYADELNLIVAPVLYEGIFDEGVIRSLFTGKSVYGDNER